MKKIIFICLTVAICVTLLAGCGNSTSGNNGYKIAVVAKSTANPWWQRMKEGIDAYNKEHGTNYFFGGPTDPVDQASYLEQLLAEDWDAICIAPYDSESIAPIFEKAKKDGIVIIAHEASTMDPQFFTYDIEPFTPKEYGENFAKQLIEMTGGEGTYIQFVSSLNTISHMEWCNAAQAYLEANSDLQFLGRYEATEDMTYAYNQTKELLQAHPEINAIECSGSGEIPGAARAIEELGLAGKIAIVGTTMGSLAAEYVRDGTVPSFSLWDSAISGKAMVALAEKVLSEGENFDPENCTLDVPGYEKMTFADGVYYGSARIDVTIDNLDKYNY